MRTERMGIPTLGNECNPASIARSCVVYAVLWVQLDRLVTA